LKVGEYTLPAGANIVLSQWVTQRDPRWFSEPEKFHPDRWSEEAAAKLPRFAYFPFGGGPRVCIGAGFAMMEATLLLATIAQRFRMRLAPNQRVKPLASITLRPKNGIRVKLEPRANASVSSVAASASIRTATDHKNSAIRSNEATAGPPPKNQKEFSSSRREGVS
jgi:Cytochrome P450